MSIQKSSSSILVTGANGFVGQHLCREILARGLQLTCATRSAYSYEQATCVQVGEINSQTDWKNALHNQDIVIHCAARVHVMNETASDPLQAFRAVNVAGTLALAQQAEQAGVRQFIYLSSVKVSGEITYDTPFTEEQAPQASDPYGISKLEAENALLAFAKTSKMIITIIRPPLVYGAGVSANFLAMLKLVRKQWPLPFASIQNQRSMVYVGNLVDFILHCIDHPRVDQQVFLISDGRDLSTPELLRLCADALQVNSRLFNFPPSALLFGTALIGKRAIAVRLCHSLQVNSDKARILLNWQAPYTVEQGLAATCAGLRSAQTALPHT
jgi:nucleoside-diphosphate-sugar epimerase